MVRSLFLFIFLVTLFMINSYVLAQDLNKDGVVDRIDEELVARAFGSKQGDHNWNPNLDLNSDGIIDMRDVALVARHVDRQQGFFSRISSFFQSIYKPIVKYFSTFTTGSTTLNVDPPEIVTTEKEFSVDITVNDVNDLFNWQIMLSFNPKVLQCTGASYPDDNVFTGKTAIPVTPTIDNTKGSVAYGHSLSGTESVSIQSGKLCNIKFKVVGSGSSPLTISSNYGTDTFLLDSDLNVIQAVRHDGFFGNEGSTTTTTSSTTSSSTTTTGGRTTTSSTTTTSRSTTTSTTTTAGSTTTTIGCTSDSQCGGPTWKWTCYGDKWCMIKGSSCNNGVCGDWCLPENLGSCDKQCGAECDNNADCVSLKCDLSSCKCTTSQTTTTTTGGTTTTRSTTTTSGSTTTSTTTTVPTTLTVISPNGGENWQQLTTHSITWWPANAGNTVKIWLIKGNLFHAAITDSTSNTGTYSWTIYQVVGWEPGTDYKVMIISNDNETVNDKSDNTFTISSAPTSSCSGNIALTLNPSTVAPSGSVTASASGLSSCDGKTVYFKRNSCTGTQDSSCLVSGTGCSGSFAAPSSTYNYYACIDKNGDLDYTDPGENDGKTLVVTQGLSLFKNLIRMIINLFGKK